MNRRKLLKRAAGATIALGLGTVGYTWRFEPHWPQVVRRELRIDRLSDALVGKRMVQLSDLHIGPIVDDAYLVRTLRSVSALQPDIIVLTGDLITYDNDRQIDQAATVLGQLKLGRLATVAILGNHDYGRRWREPRVADRLTQKLASLGIDVIRNEQRWIEGLQILGLEDVWGPRFAPQKALAHYDPTAPALALCHNPDVADLPVWGAFRGWILSGHTHGGQCKPPLLAPPILPVTNKKYSSGAFELGAGRSLYVNRGLGYNWRVRFNVRPEVTLFTLVRGAQ